MKLEKLPQNLAKLTTAVKQHELTNALEAASSLGYFDEISQLNLLRFVQREVG